MRILFLGLPLAAILLHADGHEIVLAGLCSGFETGSRRLRRQIGRDHIAIDPQDDWPGFTKRAASLRPDILVSWFFTRRIPVGLCRTTRLGGVGVHPSLLPRHRGPDPYFAAIDLGDVETGVTVHRIEAQYDTGEIISQQSIPIRRDWNAWQLAKALDRPSLQLLRKTLMLAASPHGLHSEPQDETKATWAPQPNSSTRVIRWNSPVEAICRRVRALAPSPGAVAWIGEAELVLLKVDIRGGLPKALIPGEAAIVDRTAVVRAADGGIGLLRADVDGRILEEQELAMLIAQAKSK